MLPKMPPVRKKPKLEQVVASGSQHSSIATAWHDIDDVSRQVLSQRVLDTADLLRCEMVCKLWRKLWVPTCQHDISIASQHHPEAVANTMHPGRTCR